MSSWDEEGLSQIYFQHVSISTSASAHSGLLLVLVRLALHAEPHDSPKLYASGRMRLEHTATSNFDNERKPFHCEPSEGRSKHFNYKFYH